VTAAECRRCPFWTFQWTPRLIQHTGCKTICRCGLRLGAATGTRAWFGPGVMHTGWRRASLRRAPTWPMVPTTQASHPPGPRTLADPLAAAVQAALAADPGGSR